MKMHAYLFLIGLFIIGWGCKQTPAVIEPETKYCSDWGGQYVEASDNMEAFPIPSCPNIVMSCPEIHEQAYDYYKPCFNPNNPDQIAFTQYSRKTNLPPIQALCTFDMCTGEKKILYQPCWSIPDWSVKNWIIFTGQGQQVFKIKPNGDSLTQLTFEGRYNRNPTWDLKGERFLIQREYNGQYNYLIAENGIVLDTLWGLRTHIYSWKNDSTILGLLSINLIQYSLVDKSKKTIKVFPKPNGSWEAPLSVQPFSSEDKIIWLKMEQIGISNSANYDNVIRYGAGNRRYMNIDISPNGQTIIVERKDTKVEADNIKRYVKTNLYLMDIKGMQERKILIPDTP